MMADFKMMEQLSEELLSEAEDFSEDIVAWRREFHQFPELAFEENVTSARVAQILEGVAGMRVYRSFGVATAVVAALGEDKPGPGVMFRAGMDALALDEETGLPYGSCIPGVMHACGHDAHMASLLGAATLLSSRKEDLKHPVYFVFQPAEEGKAGAKALISAGLFERFPVQRILGLYLRPLRPFGRLCIRPGTMTALSDRIHIEVEGFGGHAGSPHEAIDTITIGAHLLIAIQSMVSREVDPQETAVVTFGQVEAGEAYNIIPSSAHLWGTLRAFKEEVRDRIQDRLETMVPLLARAFRAEARIEYSRNYPPVVNDPKLTASIMEVGRAYFGEDEVHLLDRPALSGEDFSFYGGEVPAALMFMGTGGEYGVNHPRYEVPEAVLPMAAAWQAYLGLVL